MSGTTQHDAACVLDEFAATTKETLFSVPQWRWFIVLVAQEKD
jgi:hypothetical protein